MRTSEARKAALMVAVELYEAAGGQLRFWEFEIAPTAQSLGIIEPSHIEAIENYLTSTGMMEHVGIGESPLSFTSEGIAAVEASLDMPDRSHGPFPPMSVVIGDVHSGAQVAIGAGTFKQMQGGPALADVAKLVRSALDEWPVDIRRQVSAAEAALNEESAAPTPDQGLFHAALGKILKVAEQVSTSLATQALLAYARAHGLLP